MTGTGTETDPYVVTSFAELLEAIAIENAYVCVGEDLDVSADETYQVGITEPLTLYCAKLYSEGGTKKKISGLKITADNFLTTAAADAEHTVEYLKFDDCVHKKTAENATIHSKASSKGTLYLKQCEFSFKVDCGDYSCYLVGINSSYKATYLTDSSIYAEFTYAEDNTTYPTVVIQSSGTDSKRNAYHLVNARMKAGAGSGGSSLVCLLRSHENSVVIGDITLDPNTSNQYPCVFHTCDNCLACLQWTYTGETAQYLVQGKGSNYNCNVVEASRLCGDISVYSNLPSATTEQIKDQTYLAGIGFLP